MTSPCVQAVPVPVKEHLRFLEPQCLHAGSLQLRAMQTIFWCQLRLSCGHQLHRLRRRQEQLRALQQLPAGEQPTHVVPLDRTARPLRGQARLEHVGVWLGSTLAYTLFSQGPYCAVILVKARSCAGARCRRACRTHGPCK